MTAEEFFKKYVPEKEEFKIDFSNIIGLMEAYHKAKVEAVSDEAIRFNLEKYERNGARWFKEQLLKQ